MSARLYHHARRKPRLSFSAVLSLLLGFSARKSERLHSPVDSIREDSRSHARSRRFGFSHFQLFAFDFYSIPGRGFIFFRHEPAAAHANLNKSELLYLTDLPGIFRPFLHSLAHGLLLFQRLFFSANTLLSRSLFPFRYFYFPSL